MPLWDAAQREVDRWLSVSGLQQMARQARRLAKRELGEALNPPSG